MNPFGPDAPLAVTQVTPQGAVDRYWRFTLYGFYAQDTFRLTPRVRGDALDGQVNFDEAFGVIHRGKS